MKISDIFNKNLSIEFRVFTLVEVLYECVVFASSTSDKRIRPWIVSCTLCTINPSGHFSNRNNSTETLK